MNLRSRAITAIFISLALIVLSILVWAYQSGKITIFGEQATSQGSVEINSQADWKKGTPDTHVDLDSSPGNLILAKNPSQSKWENKNSQGPKDLGADPHISPVDNFTGDIIDMAYDSKDKKMVVLAYNANVDDASSFEFWTYDPAANSWAKIFAAGSGSSGSDWLHLRFPLFDETYFTGLFGHLNPIGLKNAFYVYPWAINLATNPADGTVALFTPSGVYTVNLDKKSADVLANLNYDTADATLNSQLPISAASATDSKDKKIYFFGGLGVQIFQQANPPLVTTSKLMTSGSLFVYDSSKKILSLESVSNTPPARMGASLAYNPDNNELIMFGGVTSPDVTQNPGTMKFDKPVPDPTNYTMFQDTWVYKIDSKTWEKKDPTGVPDKRAFGKMVWNPDQKVAMLYGGQTGLNSATDSLWSYNPVENKWTQNSSQTAPSARTMPRMDYDTVNKQLVTYGGRTVQDPMPSISVPGATTYPKKLLYETWAASPTGYYSSGSYEINIGSDNTISWDKFVCGPMTIPAGTQTNFQFAGSTDNVNYSQLSDNKQCANNEIGLSGLIPQGSKFIKVHINLSTSDTAQTPLIDSFKVNYTANGNTPPGPVPPNTPTGGGEPGGTLVSTGAVLWFNILVALVIAGIVTYFLVRRKD